MMIDDHCSCYVKYFRLHPVYGVDGKNYLCGCADACCVGVRVTKLGFSEVRIRGSLPILSQVLYLVHFVWLILLDIFCLFGLL